MSIDELTTMRSADDSDHDRLVQLLTTAFSELPPTRWLIPDTNARHRLLPGYVDIWVEHGLANGTVEVATGAAGGLVGMAIWLAEPGPEPFSYEQRLANAVGQKHLPKFRAFDAAMADVHPEQGHLYLAFIAVMPACQGRGYGASLLNRRHAELDPAMTPAYLVAASVASRRLYLRHGYRDCGHPITLPSGPSMLPMWRLPAATAEEASPLPDPSSPD
ncbi:GNAT family N-acetyltransferase [Kribbella sp. CA-294648]|uniref:GNAT family N-acetyltransferase n=1 Tax=Kribbella sp. CA-294648 TaxID=3239948 RepID=UPI003D8BBD35